jgi:hypothetical protein
MMKAVGRYVIVRKDINEVKTEGGLIVGKSSAYIVVSIGAKVGINLDLDSMIRLCSEDSRIALGDGLYAIMDDDVVGVL